MNIADFIRAMRDPELREKLLSEHTRRNVEVTKHDPLFLVMTNPVAMPPNSHTHFPQILKSYWTVLVWENDLYGDAYEEILSEVRKQYPSLPQEFWDGIGEYTDPDDVEDLDDALESELADFLYDLKNKNG